MIHLLAYLSILQFFHSAYSGGQTLDLCRNKSQCVEPRLCYDASAAILLECSATEKSLCVCALEVPQYCSSHSDCDAGELCARTLTTASSCISVEAISFSDDLFSITESPPLIPQPSGLQPPIWSNIGHKPSGSRCSKPLECENGNFCFSFKAGSTSMCYHPEDICRCIPRGNGRSCESARDCETMFCAVVQDTEAVCLTSSLVATISEETNVSIFLKEISNSSETPESNDFNQIFTGSPSQSEPFPSKTLVTTTFAAAPSISLATSIEVTTQTTQSVLPLYTEPNFSSELTSSTKPGMIVPTSSASRLPSVTPLLSQKPAPSASKSDNNASSKTIFPTATQYSTNLTAHSTPSQQITVPNTLTYNESVTATPATSRLLVPTDQYDNEYLVSLEPQPPSFIFNICIASKHLSKMSKTNLIFSRHVNTSVLCDTHGSCATSNHIVLFNNEPMTMSSYCKALAPLVACVQSFSLVNSPKYKRGLTVFSETQNLKFSVHAARFATKLEEFLISKFIKLGF